MIVADFVKISSETMKLLSKFGIKTDDFKHIGLFSDYEKMVAEGSKISYVVASLADKYSISEASVYRILRRFKTTL